MMVQGREGVKRIFGVSSRRAIARAMSYLFVVVGAVVILIPFFWMLSTSLKDPGYVFVSPPQWIPRPIVWRNYIDAMRVVEFDIFFKNTIYVTLMSVIGQVLTASLSAFSFARLRWPGRDFVFLVILSTMMLPHQVTMIPQFIIFRNLGWIDTLRPLWVPAYFGGGAFFIFLLRQFYMTLPIELDDAARIDGCGSMGIWWRIIVPLSKPALATVALFSFQNHWNDFLGPLIYINSRDNFTVSLGLRMFQNMYTTEWHYLMAASLVVMLPLLVIFFAAQKYFVQGIVFTGMKG